MLFPEFEEFAKYFMRDVRINASTEPFTVRTIELRRSEAAIGYSYDLDDQKLSYVESFPWIVLRRGPATGRPPANYRLAYENGSYAVWRREAAPEVLRHLALGRPQVSDDLPRCSAIRRFARGAPAGSRLVAAKVPERGFVDLPNATDRSRNWKRIRTIGGPLLELFGPGRASGDAQLKGGTYRVWVRGSFGRPVSVWIDGRQVGEVDGINTPRGWFSAARIELPAGVHKVEVSRSGGNLAPGDGAPSVLGPVILERTKPIRLVVVPRSSSGELCGGSYDWIEAVGAGALPG
jgi:hypothetical protein